MFLGSKECLANENHNFYILFNQLYSKQPYQTLLIVLRYSVGVIPAICRNDLLK